MRMLHFGANPVDRLGLKGDESLRSVREDDRDPDIDRREHLSAS
jgi:hypothetical protein